MSHSLEHHKHNDQPDQADIAPLTQDLDDGHGHDLVSFLKAHHLHIDKTLVNEKFGAELEIEDKDHHCHFVIKGDGELELKEHGVTIGPDGQIHFKDGGISIAPNGVITDANGKVLDGGATSLDSSSAHSTQARETAARQSTSVQQSVVDAVTDGDPTKLDGVADMLNSVKVSFGVGTPPGVDLALSAVQSAQTTIKQNGKDAGDTPGGAGNGVVGGTQAGSGNPAGPVLA